MVEPNNDVNKPVETSDEPLRKATKESVGEERKMAELPKPQPVSFYLNHKINEKLIGGLIGNPKLTNEKLLETDVRLALAINSHVYPLGVAKDVLVEVTGLVYPVDFMILDIKEDVKKPLILGPPFLTMARAEIKFDKGTISLRSGKSTVQFYISPDPSASEERDENKVNTLSVVNERVLEWVEKIKFHYMKNLKHGKVSTLKVRHSHPKMKVVVELVKTMEESRKE
ncbi:reverse transcriptase domain-containing protein [Tanacetum coccineum]|uniref:Reverse transcriptase domain-containing protein n=1 Tax=Tanacetum coccineum TaxID=301880 RepID=A0ABQ4ZVP1_9ASTR